MESDLRLVGLTFILMVGSCFAPGLFAQDEGVVAKWSFEETAGRLTRDSVGGTEDKVEGFFKYVPGVYGSGRRFDGYTTSVTREAKKAPQLHEAFSVEAWIALNTYPWNLVPVVDQQTEQQVGYFFGIDALGHDVYYGEKTFFTFECWNHWPVAQIASSGRPCVAPDRASHTSVSHIYWDPFKLFL